MTERSRTTPSPARYGLAVERGTSELRAAGWWDDAGPTWGANAVLTALSRCPDPDLALLTLDRLRTGLGDVWIELDLALREDPSLRGRLLAVLGTSTALGDFLAADPRRWRVLVGDHAMPREATSELLAAVEGTTSRQEAVHALRVGYRSLLLRVAAADLACLAAPELPSPSYEDVTAALTELAEAALRAALVVASREVGAPDDGTAAQAHPLAVIAMGKCGGRELNYVSDVDVVFVAEGNDRYTTRLAAAAMRVAGEAAFEVDASLRPEGRSGALVRSLDGYLNYYRRWARTWEFQALLKARPVAGDPELGQRFVDSVSELCWTAADRDDFVADVRAMRRRVEEHVPAELVERELKLGRGGLRDVEFAVQLLQLVHGRGDNALRCVSTIDALRALGEGGYVGRQDAAGLRESYEFVRTLEHRLQLRKLRRTHLLPADDDVEELRWLARSAGIPGSGGSGSERILLGEFRRHAGRIRRLHEKLFYRPLLEAVSRVPTEALRMTTAQAEARLAALGYAGPDGALNHIGALTSGVSRRASIQGALLPVLLDLLAETPDPDGGLLAYRKMSESLAQTPWYLRLLRDEGAVVERLAQLLGTSKVVPELAIRAPEGLRLLADDHELAHRDPDEVAASLRSAVRRHQGVAEAVTAARSLRRYELMRVACADLLGMLDVRAVCEALSSVWVAVLQSALPVAERARAADGGGAAARIAVIGMGRLGGAELGYSSDADVMFVCEPVEGYSDVDAVRYATDVVRDVRGALGSPSQDPPLHVDADLRPEGRGGALVRTLRSYLKYYERWGETWEAQALLRARVVAGDAALGERFISGIDPIRYPKAGLTDDAERELKRIKARVENERLPRGADPATNTKLGRGGLADVEWTVQLLQLMHAHELPELCSTSTLDSLDALGRAGLLHADDVTALSTAWLLATRARNATMLVRGKASDQLPTSGRELVAVARVVAGSDDDPGAFVDGYRRVTRHARSVVERVFYS